MTPAFNVGDRVRLVGRGWDDYAGILKVGDVVEITGHDEDGLSLFSDPLDEFGTWYTAPAGHTEFKEWGAELVEAVAISAANPSAAEPITVAATGYEDYLAEDRPTLFIEGGAGNAPGVTEVHLTYLDPTSGDETHLGWFPRAALEDALARTGHTTDNDTKES